MTASKRHVLDALHEGKITRAEADAYLNAVHGTSLTASERRRHVHAYLVILALLGAVVLGALNDGGITGFVTLEAPEANITQANITINVSFTRLTVTGMLYGEGTATFRLLSEQEYLVGSVSSDPGAVRTSEASYLPGENVTLDHVTGEATYYLDDGEQTMPISVPFPAPAVGEYDILVVQNNSGNLSASRTPLIVSDTPVPRTTAFTALCNQTCVLPETTGILQVSTNGTTVQLDRVDVTPAAPNQEPGLVLPFTDMEISEPVSVNLDQHFEDPEGEQLLYSTSTGEFVDPDVNGNILTITPISDGAETFTVYASDLEYLVQASFTIVSSAARTNATEENVTVTNVTVENVTRTNQSSVSIANETNATLSNATIDCSDPDPNKRPVDCLNQEAATYFEEDIFWEDVSRQRVARITPIGNLLIEGRVFKYATVSPDPNDFTVGYKDDNFAIVPTVRIDSDGDLYLSGTLHEENNQLTPPPGSYAAVNRRGVYLAYIDRERGDLYLRGNVIPFREDVG